MIGSKNFVLIIIVSARDVSIQPHEICTSNIERNSNKIVTWVVNLYLPIFIDASQSWEKDHRQIFKSLIYQCTF